MSVLCEDLSTVKLNGRNYSKAYIFQWYLCFSYVMLLMYLNMIWFDGGSRWPLQG
jgi:hypothetical protein